MIADQDYELVPVDELTPHPDNPRKGNVDAIAASIAANGFRGAIVRQKSTGFVLSGNHSLKALKQLGESHAPTLTVDVDDDHAKRLLLAFNRTSDLGGYDDEALAGILHELSQLDDLDGTGYTDDDVDEILRATDAFGDHAASFLSELPDPPATGSTDAPSATSDSGSTSTPTPAPAPDPPKDSNGDAPVYFQLAYTTTLEERDAITKALKAMKARLGANATSPQALAAVCREWIEKD